jgi:hypothetical protein
MGVESPENGEPRVNPWPYVLAAYLLAAAAMLCYLVSVNRRTKAMTAKVAALLKRYSKEAA